DAVTAIQRVALTPEGAKIGRRMLGIVHRAAVKLDQAGDPLHVGEGVETMMAARQLGLAPAWALGSAGMVAHFPVTSTGPPATCASAARATRRARAPSSFAPGVGRRPAARCRSCCPPSARTSTTSCNMEIINPVPDDDGGDGTIPKTRKSKSPGADDFDAGWL